MGRGLAAILPQPGEVSEPALRQVPTKLVLPNPEQPRRRCDAESISALAESLRSAGVIQPLIVRPLTDGRYEIIAGERRWRAATEAGLETVPVILRDEDEGERMQTALIENVAREQLNPVHLDHGVDGESGAGLALTPAAVTSVHEQGCSLELIAHSTAGAAATQRHVLRWLTHG